MWESEVGLTTAHSWAPSGGALQAVCMEYQEVRGQREQRAVKKRMVVGREGWNLILVGTEVSPGRKESPKSDISRQLPNREMG